MKILLTFFVLLFSSSVLAGDDLTGKKIFCKAKLVDKDLMYAAGIIFRGTDYLGYYFQTSIDEKKYFVLKYKTSPMLIKIYNPGGEHIFDIDRKNLGITFHKELYSKNDFNEGDCKITKENVSLLIDDYFKEIIGDNLI